MSTVRDDAPWCPWNIEFIRRVNGLDDVDDVHRIVFDADVPRPRPRRRLPRRAGRDPARPAPPARHHEVQPGADLDARERGRHRRRVPVRLRHGGPGRLPVRRPHRAGVEPLPPHPRVRPALAAAVLRPDPVLPGERGRTARLAADLPPAALELDITPTRSAARRPPRVPRRQRGVDRARSGTGSRRPSARSARLGRGRRVRPRGATEGEPRRRPRRRSTGGVRRGAALARARVAGRRRAGPVGERRARCCSCSRR